METKFPQTQQKFNYRPNTSSTTGHLNQLAKSAPFVGLQAVIKQMENRKLRATGRLMIISGVVPSPMIMLEIGGEADFDNKTFTHTKILDQGANWTIGKTWLNLKLAQRFF